MKRVVLTATGSSRSEKGLLARFLYGVGLIERKKTKEPLALLIMQIFLKNKDRPMSYEHIFNALQTKDVANVIKVCNKLADFGIIERTAYVPKGRKRWTRAFKFVDFSSAVRLTKQRTRFALDDLTKQRGILHG